MNHKISKISTIVVNSFFILIGGFLVVSAIGSGDPFFLVFGLVVFSIALLTLVLRLKQFSKFEKMTYQWYKSEHPDHVHGNKVSCFACGNERINVRAIMNHTYHREHLCAQCGKTLYYSPEQS